MATPIYDRYSYNCTRPGRDSVNMTEHHQEPAFTRPQSTQLPTPSPSASRWSQTTRSVSVYEEDGFGDDETTLREVTPVARSIHASTPANTETKRTITVSDVLLVLCYVVMIGVSAGIIVMFVKILSNNNNGVPPPSSTSTHKTMTSTLADQQQGAHHSPTTTSQSSTAAVVQVATQVMLTTVGTLTESETFPGAINT